MIPFNNRWKATRKDIRLIRLGSRHHRLTLSFPRILSATDWLVSQFVDGLAQLTNAIGLCKKSHLLS